ncbi:hypothetical protein ZIOFF_064646 [Zingiber officinale]|uniref:mRNA-decapping enzyme-like protein n=1 Tax=Zingiber officinale TaxID=94328 RepID=A0A8J5KAN3_ZINOF|nr:hypothetical protein ZIOFF_064646 [Zingiber officinale]
MTQSGKLMPNLDQNSTKLHNLTVLQRVDSFVEEILMTAAHVTVYEFNIELNQWVHLDWKISAVKTWKDPYSLSRGSSESCFSGIPGCLKKITFMNAQPRFQFIVMNRRNMDEKSVHVKVEKIIVDNLVENLLGDFEYEVQVPYLFYRNAAQEVNGIWFYNSLDCEAVTNLFLRILNAYSKVPPKPKVTSKRYFSYHSDPAFSYCNSEFEELEAVPTSSIIEGPLEPTSAATPTPDVADETFVKFFSVCFLLNSFFHHISYQLRHVFLNSHLVSSVNLRKHQASILNPPVLPTVQSVSVPSVPSTPQLLILDNLESSNGSSSSPTNLVKPSFFLPAFALLMPSVPSSVPAAPPLHPPATMQLPFGTPLLQPFPPPTPSASLAHSKLWSSNHKRQSP